MTPRTARPMPEVQADPTQTHLAKELKQGSPLISCRFDPTGRYLVAGAEDSTLKRWELESEHLTELKGHESWVRSLAFSPESSRLFTADYAGRLLAWPLNDDEPEPLWAIDAHDGWARAVAVSPDGALLATSGNDHLVKLWNADDDDGELIHTLSGHDSHVYNLAFHPSGEHLISGDLKGVLHHWDVASGTEVRQFQGEDLHIYDKTFRADIGGVRSIAFNADGSRLACAGTTNVSNAFAGVGDPVALVFDWESGVIQTKHLSKADLRGVCWGVAFLPDDVLAGVSGGSGGGHLLFWNPDEAPDFHSLKLPNTARDLALHPDGLLLAVAHFDGSARLYLMAPDIDADAS